MKPEKWQKVKSILEKAMSFAPDSRPQYLSEVCCGDEDLRREIEMLLDFDNTKADFLEQSAFSAVFDKNGDSTVGKQIDKYKITDKLGAGGMGAVFLAQRSDGAFEQKVALKLIKRGMDSDAILRRFFIERQILASLKHPNIAHVIDGGTTEEGLPFFVMEYVDGESITEYAGRNDLNLEERLKLFREICAAVSFAHSNLVIHRDLKPSNILVTEDGQVKLLDFGIAKLLKSETDAVTTATQNFIFTPEYASPEQVKGEKLTTASDVYSLGVILYELLTGSRPYQTASQSIGDIIKAVCETEPQRPSSVGLRPSSFVSRSSSAEDENLTDRNEGQKTKDEIEKTEDRRPNTKDLRALRGDLDNIILKALRKEPERRYASVEQFSEDIRRHLEGLPVTASKDTWTYRASKFVQRNRVAVAAAGLVLLVLLGGLAATAYQASVARRERAKAEQRFADVRQLANSFLFEFHDSIKDLSGATPARELVVKRAVEYLDKLAAESGNTQNVELQRELATAYERIGKIQGNSFFSNLGDTAGAMASYQKSLEIRQRLYQAQPANREIRHELASAYEGIGDMFYTDNDLSDGLRNYEEALKIRLPLVEAEPQNRKYLHVLAELHTRTGLIKGTEGYANLGDTLGALSEHERAVAIAEKLVAVQPDEDAQTLLAGDLIYLAMQQNAVGKSADALANGRKAVVMYETLAARNPNNAAIKEYLMTALTVLRYSLIDENLLPEAEKNARYVLAETEKAAAADPKDVNAQEDLSISYNDLARVLKDGGKTREAIALHERALQIIEKINSGATSGELQTTQIQTRRFLALAQLDAGDYSAALANFEQCAEASEKDLAKSPENARIKDDLAIAYTGMGSALSLLDQPVRADEFFTRAVSLAEETARQQPQNIRVQSRLAKTYFESGKHWKQFFANEKAQAKSCELLQKSFDVWDGLRQKGILSKFNQPRPDEVFRELTACR